MNNIKALFHYDPDTDCIDLRTKDTGELIVSLSAVQLHAAIDKLRGSHTKPDETVGIIAMLPDAKRTPHTDTNTPYSDTVPVEEIANQPFYVDSEANAPSFSFNIDRATIAADLYSHTYASTVGLMGPLRAAEAAKEAVRFVMGEV